MRLIRQSQNDLPNHETPKQNANDINKSLMKSAGDAILDDFLHSAGDHVRRNAISLLTSIDETEDEKCFMSDEDY